MIFKDRIEAGKKLAEKLQEYKDKNVLILGIPRGGVVVANELAKSLRGELDVIVTKKIGAPGNPEFAIGAVDSKGHLILNEDIAYALEDLRDYLDKEKEKITAKVKEYEKKFRGEKPPLKIRDRVVIITDDGVATGSTLLTAIEFVKEESPKEIIVVIPVGPLETLEKLKEDVDKLVFLHAPRFFMSVGQFYENFEQTTDEEVTEILERSRSGKCIATTSTS